MADKEKIEIDGVDVSGCSYYNPLGNYNCGGTKKCSQWTNCYFKQLARKTQEYEELKSQIDADYEYYSQQLKILRNIIENKEKRNARLFVISNNYRKALEEIEEVWEKDKDGDYDFVKRQIFNIINKAKEENEQRE